MRRKQRNLKDFDGSRKNIISTTSISCIINYFDVDSVSQLTLSVVQDVKSIRLLDLSCNRISTIENDTFNQFAELESLGENFLAEVRAHYFNGLGELSRLDLSSNLISGIEENSFAMLGSLLWLNLADYCIINLDLNMPLAGLNTLNLSHNSIASFPRSINIEAIDILDLSHNTNGVLNFNIDLPFSHSEREKIASFAAKIVKSLNAADNELTDLAQFKSFTRLDELNLAGNPNDYNLNAFPYLPELKN